MARAHFVKRARKAIPSAGIKVGDPYWHWTFRNRGGKGSRHVSKTMPKRSQLTRSEYLGTLYDIEDRITELEPNDGLTAAVEEIASALRELGEAQTEKRDNMPESLQNSDTGSLLEERADACENAASELEGLDLGEFTADPDHEFEEGEDPDVPRNDEGQTEDEYWEARLTEVQDVSLPSS